MRKTLWKYCLAFIFAIGLVVGLIPGQTVLANDDENEQPSYRHLDENQIYGNAERDEVFITNILDESDIVTCYYGEDECYDWQHYRRNIDDPIEFDIVIDRYFGPVDANGRLIHLDNIEQGTVQLSLRAFDVDSDYEIGSITYHSGEMVYPEVDEVYINDHPEPIGMLRGFDAQWSLTTIDIPVEYLRFPDLDEHGYVIPEANTIKIKVDVANARSIWETVVERGWLTIKGVRPVVLVHGFVSSEDTWVEWTKPGGYVEEHGIPMHTFSFPNNHQDWNINAYLLGEQLAIAKDRFGVSKLNVIGHSKGGLDTRGYLHVFNQFDVDIENLFMLGTPNGGSPLASMGTTVSMLSWELNLLVSHILDPALTQLTVGYMSNIFNETVLENPKTDYYVLPGFCCTSIFMGQSDKIVPVFSVLKLPYAEDIGLTEDDHFTLTKNREVFDIVIDKLGIRSHSRGLRTFGTNDISEDVFFQMGDGGGAEISVGQTNEHSFRLSEESDPSLVIMTETPVDVSILDPSGQEVAIDSTRFFDPAELFPRIEVTIMDSIVAGTWTLEVSHLSETGEPAKYGWLVADVGGPTLHVTISPTMMTSDDETITIEATIEDLDEGEELNVQATVRLPDGTLAEEPVTLTHSGNGIYEGEFVPDHNQSGDYMVLVTAENDDVIRRQLSAFTQLSRFERLPVSYTARGVDSDDDGLFDSLEIEVPLQIDHAGTYMVNADLYDSHDNYITSAMMEDDLTADASTIVLSFSGLEIATSRFADDLILKNVQLHNLTSSSYSDWQAGAVATFSHFNWEQFQRPRISVLSDIEDRGILSEDDEENEGKFQYLSVTIPVHVLREATYTINARLVDADGTEVDQVGGWYVDPIVLTEGDIELTIQFNGEFIRANGQDGPYFVKDFTLEEYYYIDENDDYRTGVNSLVIADLHETKFYDSTAFVLPREPAQLILSVPSSPSVHNGIYVTGQVLDHKDRGVSGVTVQFSLDDGPPIAEALTYSGRDWRDPGDFNTYIYTTKAGAMELKATVEGTDISETLSISVAPAAASKLKFSAQPTDTTIGETLQAVEVHVVDEYDNLTNNSSEVTLSVTNDDAPLYGTTTVKANRGVAIFDDLEIFTAGTYTLTATANVAILPTKAESIPFTIAPVNISGEPNSMTLDMMPTELIAGESSSISGYVLDHDGLGVSGVVVEFSFSDGSTITPVVTGADGSYMTSFSPHIAGAFELTVTVSETSITETVNFTVTPAAAYGLTFTVQPEHTYVGEIINPLEARWIDQFGNFVAIQREIEIFMFGTPLNGEPTVVMSDAEGRAIFEGLSIDNVGTQTLHLRDKQSSSSYEQGVSDVFVLLPKEPLKITLQDPNSPVIAGHSLTLRGDVTYSADNTGLSLPVRFSAIHGPTPPQVNSAWNGRYNSSYVPTTAEIVQMTATIVGTDISATINFEVAPAPASKLVFGIQPVETTSGETMETVQVRLLDPFGNLASDALDVTLSISDSLGDLHGTTTVTATGGLAIFDDLRIDTAGNYTLTATALGLAGIQSEGFSVKVQPSNGEPGGGNDFADQLIITQPTASILYSTPIPIVGETAENSTITASVYSEQNIIVVPAFAVDVTTTDDDIFVWMSNINEPLAPGAYQLRITAERNVDGAIESATKVHDFVIPQLTLTGVSVDEYAPDQATFTFNQHVDPLLNTDHFAGLTLDGRQVVAVNAVQGAIVTIRLNASIGPSDPLIVTYNTGSVNIHAASNPLNALHTIAEHDQDNITKENGIIPFTLASVYTEDGQLNLVFNKPVHEEATLQGFTYGGQPLQGVHKISGNTMTVTLPTELANHILSYDPTQGNMTEKANESNPLSGLLPGIDLGENHAYVSDIGQLLDAGIRLNNGQVQLSPVFNPNDAGVYEAIVPNSIEHISLNPAPAGHAGTFVKVSSNGVEYTSDTWNHLPLQVGMNTIVIEIGDQSNPHIVLGQYKVALARESSSSQETTPPTTSVPAPPETEIIEILTIERTTHPDGTITDQVTIDEDVAQTLVNKAIEMGDAIVRIVIPDSDDEVSEVKVDMATLGTHILAEHGMALEIFTDHAIIQLSNETLKGINDDVYFRLVPVKSPMERHEIGERITIESVVREVAGDNDIEVVAHPMTIETNLSSLQVTLVLPLSDVVLPEDPAERAAFLAKLGIFIEHSDGDKEVVRGSVVSYDEELLGLAFTVTKFSIFTIVSFGDAEFGTHQAYISGFPDGEFKPDEWVTRAQMALMLARNLGVDSRRPVDESPFEDVAVDHYAASAIAFVQTEGIMNGYPDGQFRSDHAISRAEMAMIAANYLNLTKAEGVPSHFNDTAGHWAQAAIEANFAAGIVVGYTDGSFRPEQHATRAEAVVFVNKIFNRGPLYDAHVSIFPDVAASHWAFEHILEAAIDHDYVIDMYQQEQWQSE